MERVESLLYLKYSRAIENLYLTTGSQWFNSGGDYHVARGFLEVVECLSLEILPGTEIIAKCRKQLYSDLPGIIVEINPEEGEALVSAPQLNLGIFGNNEDQVAQVTQSIERYLTMKMSWTYQYKFHALPLSID